MQAHSRTSLFVALLTIIGVILLSSMTAAQREDTVSLPGSASFSRNRVSIGDSVFTELPSRAPITITQNTDPNTVTSGNSVACNDGTGIHTDSSYYRAFPLADFGLTNGLTVQSIDIGIEAANAGGATQPVTVRLHTSSAAVPTNATLTEVASANFNVADTSLTVSNFPIAGAFEAGSILVVEVFTPNGTSGGNTFFIGSNAAGQSGPSYIKAPDCGVTDIVTTAAIGEPNMHIVMRVNGEDVAMTSTPEPATATPTEEPGVELLVNGGFEALDANNKPDITPWVVKNGIGDKAKCNKDKDGNGVPDKIFSHTGNCAFRFKGGAGENSKLQQNVDLTGLTPAVGDALNFSAWVNGGNAPALKAKVRVKYTDGTEKGKINADVVAGSAYVEITGSTDIASTAIDKISVAFKNKAASGKSLVDDVSLRWVSDALPTATVEATTAPTLDVTAATPTITPTDTVTNTPTITPSATPSSTPSMIPSSTASPPA
jgi:hypothetical protein